MSRALITGITGQDGSYLAEILVQRKWKVFGMVRRVSSQSFWRLATVIENIEIVQGDITDLASLLQVIEEVQPTHVFNLASQSFVPTSWKQPILTSTVTGLGALNVFEACRIRCPDAKIYQASSSEMFGLQPIGTSQDENTSFHPRSPYGCSKVFAHNMGINYRESYDMYISCGILFNHESERRGTEFVTRKIAVAAARIALGLQHKLELGNMDASRDWGFAKDYVLAMILMVEQDTPDDFVIATGKTNTVREFVQHAFEHVSLDWKQYIETDAKLFRPAEIPALCGNTRKAKSILNWEPTITFIKLVQRMVDYEMARIQENISG
jgi:GDPmannose 4,6-dehydratase